MPAVARDNGNKLYTVFRIGDSILFAVVNAGNKILTTPALVGVLQELVSSHMRGPQVTVTAGGTNVIACNQSGNIFVTGVNNKVAGYHLFN